MLARESAPENSFGNRAGPRYVHLMNADMESEKATLHRYLQRQRDAILFKLDGLDERQIRLPATPTGTNLLGLVKHLTWVELGYLGACLNRPLAGPWPWEATRGQSAPGRDEELADQWARADESREDIVEGYQQAWAHGDAAILTLPLTTTAEIPWWPEERRHPSLHTLLIHLIAETARHAGHADIIREGLDGGTGMSADNSNLPELTDEQWAQHLERLRQVAAEVGEK